MNNFKQHSSSKTRSANVDGFVRRSSLGGASVGDPSKKNFGVNEGFYAKNTKRSQLPDGRALGRKPLRAKDLEVSESETSTLKKPRLKQKKWKRVAHKGLKTAATFSLLLAGFLVGFAYLRATQIFQGGTSALGLSCEVDPARLEKEGDGRVNVLLLGKGGPGHDGADLTDTLMVASVDTCAKDVSLLSIPRDLYVQMPDQSGSMKINSVYVTAKQKAAYEGQSKKNAEKAGIEAAEQVTEEVLGIPIHYYAMVDFEAFRKAIDTVGGVDVNVKEQLYDPTVAWENDWDPVIAEKGQNHFNGKQALLYARSRYGSERGDFDRSERQREILVALRNKAFTLGTFGNPLKISQLLNAFGSHVQTNLSVDDMMKLYEVAQEVQDHKVTSVGLADPPNDYVTTSSLDGLSVVIPKAGIYVYDDIHAYVRNKLRDGYLRKENATVLVLNGTTTPGLASQYAKTLKDYGYKVAKSGDAPSKDYDQTQVIDLRNGDKKYTKRYLELRFNTSANNDLPSGINPGNADFVIIVGQNETRN